MRVSWVTSIGELHRDGDQEEVAVLVDALNRLGFEPIVTKEDA